MPYQEMARQFVASVIAMALHSTVAVVERMLPHRPDWVERIDHLAARFRSLAADENRAAPRPSKKAARGAGRAATAPAGSSTPLSSARGEGLGDMERLSAAYNELWQFVQAVKEQGLSLDEAFCERVQQEWTTNTLLGYVQTVETTLRENATQAQSSAAAHMAPDREC